MIGLERFSKKLANVTENPKGKNGFGKSNVRRK